MLLTSIGLPGLNGFVGEFLVLLGTFIGYRWWVVPAAFGIVLAAVYLLWAYGRVFHGEVREENRNLPDLNVRELAMLAPLLVMITVIGVYPRPFLERIEPTASRVVEQLRFGTADPDKIACLDSVAPGATSLPPCFDQLMPEIDSPTDVPAPPAEDPAAAADGEGEGH